MQRRVRLEADHIAAVADVNERAFAGTGGTTLQAVLVEVSGTEVFAVTAILPLQVDWRRGLTFEVDLAEKVSAVLTLDGVLSRCEESFFVFRTEYSHFRSSL